MSIKISEYWLIQLIFETVISDWPPDRPGYSLVVLPLSVNTHVGSLISSVPVIVGPQLPPCMRAYACACVRHTCSCSCVVPAKGPLSLPGQTALSPLDRWPAPSLLLHIPSLHLPLIPFFHHCLPLLRALDTSAAAPPPFPTSQQPLLTPQHLCRSKSGLDKKAFASLTLPASESRASM